MGEAWSLQDAKNKFSAVVDAAEKGEPQRVTKRGKDAVVVLSAAEYERLVKLDVTPAKSFTQHLLDFPKLPDGMADFLDFDTRPELVIPDIDLVGSKNGHS